MTPSTGTASAIAERIRTGKSQPMFTRDVDPTRPGIVISSPRVTIGGQLSRAR